jgi:aminocarboxymuconate-semialdehyde decarboxylase
MLGSTVGLDQVLFGTDYPYLRRELAVDTRQRILESPELEAPDRTRILGGTATTLIPRLARQRPAG